MSAYRCFNTECKCNLLTAVLKTPGLVFNFPLLLMLYNADLDFPPRLPSSHNCAVAVETSARCRDADRCDKKGFIMFSSHALDSFLCLYTGE